MDKDTKIRPLYLAEILFRKTDEEHYLTTAQLTRELENEYGISAHRQTIKSDINLLRKAGLDIQEVKSSQNRYNLIERPFDTVELKLLIDAVVSARFITKAKSEDLAAKLASLASDHRRQELKRNISCENRIKSGNEKIFLIADAINDAINAGKKVTFQYFRYNGDGKKEFRNNGDPYVITPLYLVWNGDYYYMIGVNEQGELRTFRVDRIANCPEILEEDSVSPPKGFNLDRYLNTTFSMFDSDRCEVSLLCDNSVMDAIIDRFGMDARTHRYDSSNFTAVANVAISHIFYTWIFGFDGLVRIQGPESVRTEYADMVRRAAEAL